MWPSAGEVIPRASGIPVQQLHIPPVLKNPVPPATRDLPDNPESCQHLKGLQDGRRRAVENPLEPRWSAEPASRPRPRTRSRSALNRFPSWRAVSTMSEI